MFVNVVDMVQQGVELSEQPHIVVSTPGRLADHLRTGTNFSLTIVSSVIQDSAIEEHIMTRKEHDDVCTRTEMRRKAYYKAIEGVQWCMTQRYH